MDEVALVALLFGRRGAKPAELRRSFEDNLTPLQVLEQSPGALVGLDVSSELAEAEALVASWAAQGIRLLTPFDVDYPEQMRVVWDYPVLLFARGRVQDDSRSAAVVGSRAASESALRFSADVAAQLSDADVTVVSGLARGIDGAAHHAVLDAHRRTVAVLGNGLNQVYPREHAAMQQRIEETGLLLSQWRPDEGPTRYTFPMRNITMSAYSTMTIIVEAAEKSGTRIQADAALHHGRPLIITEQVALSTKWGARYAEGGYDVTVVRSPAEAAAAAVMILERLEEPAPMIA